MRFDRRQYIDLLTFGQSDRPMFVELFGPLIGLADEWRSQGATEDEINMVAFDWDYVPIVGCGANTHPIGGQAEVVLEDTPEHLIKRDFLGRTLKLCKQAATIPLPLDFPVKNMDDWLKLKPMFLFNESRINADAIAAAKAAQQRGELVVASIPGAFNWPRELMGEEVACLAYYEQPELMHDIVDTLAKTSLEVLRRVSDRITIDQLSVHEDLAGKSGPLIGPAQIAEYVRPYFRGVWNMLSSRGTRIFQMDSDGNLNPVMDAFLDCGLTSIFPMEPAAGMDVVALRRKFGTRLAMLGGIDKHVLRRSREEIEAELEYKLQPCMRKGYVAGIDHRIPNGTSIDNYRYYVKLGREILGLPPLSPGAGGWRRMAF
jgi:uroporphyrinogen-III decarboxylase